MQACQFAAMHLSLICSESILSGDVVICDHQKMGYKNPSMLESIVVDVFDPFFTSIIVTMNHYQAYLSIEKHL